MRTLILQAFIKRASILAHEEDADYYAPELLARSISKAGPVLADLTQESDRGKFEEFKG